MQLHTLLMFFVLVFASCSKLEQIEPAGIETNIEADSIVFAGIGDYGYDGIHETYVAEMVKSWNPDFIITAGDNNYTEGKLKTIIANIGKHFGDYIYNYDAPSKYQCKGKAFNEQINRFFPAPGNHDANNKDKLVPYFNYFTLPGNENYYSFTWGPVTFYSLNTLENNLSIQKKWLEDKLKQSSSQFNIVFCHHPPYSNGTHGCNTNIQWDFKSMGVDVVFAGHDHIYNRIQKKGEDDVYYIVNGLGGMNVRKCNENPLPENIFSTFNYDGDYGATKAIVTKHKLTMEFYSISNPGSPIDRIQICK